MDRYGIPTQFSYDYLDRLTNHTTVDPQGLIPDAVENFNYSARGLTNYIDALTHPTEYVRDALGRVLYETNANNELTQYTYNPIETATQSAVSSQGITGVFEIVVTVGTENMTVRGAVVNGAVRVGTAFIVK